MTPRKLLSLFTRPNQDETLVLHRGLPELDPTDFSSLLQGQDELGRITPRHFESLVAELLRSDGYEEVHLIPRVNAPGPDIIAICRGPSGQKQEYIVECKRWHDAVGLDVVRQTMYRVDTERRSTGAIIVTTSRFTREAVEEAQRLHQWRLDLRDGEAVLNWVNTHATQTRREVLSAQRLERLRSTPAGELLFAVLNNPHVPAKIEIAESTCKQCNGPEICGLASLGSVLEPLFCSFHVCLICLSGSSTQVNEPIPQCLYCGAPRPFHGVKRKFVDVPDVPGTEAGSVRRKMKGSSREEWVECPYCYSRVECTVKLKPGSFTGVRCDRCDFDFDVRRAEDKSLVVRALGASAIVWRTPERR